MTLPLGPLACALVIFRRLFDAPPRIGLPRLVTPSPASSTFWQLAEPLLRSSSISAVPPSLPRPRRVVVIAPSLLEKFCAASPPSVWPSPPALLLSPHSFPFSWAWESKTAARPSSTQLLICSHPPTTRISASASSWLLQCLQLHQQRVYVCRGQATYPTTSGLDGVLLLRPAPSPSG